MKPQRKSGGSLPAFILVLALAGLVAGAATFSLARHSTVRHQIEQMQRPSIGGSLSITALGALLAAAYLAGRGRNRMTRAPRLARALWPAALGMPLAAGQWAAWWSGRDQVEQPSDGPWLLYLWIALLAYCGSRLAVLIHALRVKPRTLWMIVAGGVAVVVGVQVSMQYELWNELSFGYHDIGLFARAIHNAAHGRGLYIESLGCSTMAEHAEFLLWLLVPLCRLGLDPFHLLVLVSAGSLALPAFAIAWYLSRRLSSPLAGVIGATAWLLLPSHGCLVVARGYGFHPVYLAVPLLVGGLVFGFLRRWGAATLCMLLACLAREEVGLTVAAWAVYVALVEKRRVLGLVVAAVSVAYFCCMVFLVIPHWRGAPYPWIAAHYNASATVSGIWGGLGTDVAFIATLLLPMAVLFMRPSALLLAALPALIETILTTNPELHSLSVHYYTPVVPVLFMAAVRAWERTAANLPDSVPLSVAPRPVSNTCRSARAGSCLLISACLGQVYLGLGPHTNNPVRPMSSPGLAQSVEGVRALRAALPRDLVVTASYRVAAHFLDQDRLLTVGNEQIGDLVVIDDRDNWDGSQPRSALVRALRRGGYQPILADYHLVALLRTVDPSPLALEVRPPIAPTGLAPQAVDLGEGIHLIALGAEPGGVAGEGVGTCRVTLIWRCEHEVPKDYRFGLTLGEGLSRWGPFYFARGAYPTVVWRPGELYRDDVQIAVPAGELRNLSALSVTLLH